jgi:hypothetical protein
MTMLNIVTLFAAATPLPVHVQNWPSPLQSDAVALDTLKYARWAFWSTVIIGIPSLIFGVVDYSLNMRQFRRPKLSVSLLRPYEAIEPYAHDDDNRNYKVKLVFRLINHGRKATGGCYVALWIPNFARVSTPEPRSSIYISFISVTQTSWRTSGDNEEMSDAGGQHFETFVAEPVFVDHPIILPAIELSSDWGPFEFECLWRVYDEAGKHPPNDFGILSVTVRAVLANGGHDVKAGP